MYNISSDTIQILNARVQCWVRKAFGNISSLVRLCDEMTATARLQRKSAGWHRWARLHFWAACLLEQHRESYLAPPTLAGFKFWAQLIGKCANSRLDVVQPPSAILRFILTPTVISQLQLEQKSVKEYAEENSFGKIHKRDTAGLIFHILHWKSIVYHHLLLHAKLHLSRLHCKSSSKLMQNCNLNCWQAFLLLLGFSLE